MDYNKLAIECIKHQRKYHRAERKWWKRYHNDGRVAIANVVIAILDDVDTTSVETIRRDLRKAYDLIRKSTAELGASVSIRISLKTIESEINTYYDLM